VEGFGMSPAIEILHKEMGDEKYKNKF